MIFILTYTIPLKNLQNEHIFQTDKYIAEIIQYLHESSNIT